MFEGIKIKWNNYLKRLGEVNEKLYGSKKLDCCSMNTSHKVQYGNTVSDSAMGKPDKEHNNGK